MFEKYLHTSQTGESGIQGIYPPFLKLKCEQDSVSEVSFLDVLLYKSRGVIYTKIFDKREHPPLSSVDQIKYPDPSSFLSYRSKYGIITSRLHCFGRICHRKVDFVTRSRKFLKEFLSRGYSKSATSIHVKRFLKTNPLAFPIVKLGSFVKGLLNF